MKAPLAVMFCCLYWLPSVFAADVKIRHESLPDVYLITIDTLRADHIHCYGYDAIQTPVLDSLARDGVRFSAAFTPSPITNTSHVSILTGLLPGAHGVTDFAIPLAPGHRTLAEVLKEHGYQTAAFIGAVILDSKTLAPGLDRGFDFYDNFPSLSTTKSRWGRVERRGTDVVQRSESWLSSHKTGPHFVWIHLYDPHDPYEPPPPYSEIYKTHLYDGEIAYADFALGKFIAYLKRAGNYDNSLIIAVGDHGEGLGEHNEETHGIFLYDSTTHVPLIVKPVISSSRKMVDAQVRTVDILPTILDLLKLSPPERPDGESLKTYFDGKNSVGRPSFGETDYPLRFGWAPLHSIRADGFKFIEAPKPELYDLREDSKELTNTYQPWDATVQTLRHRLAELRSHDTASPVPVGAVGADTLNELRALGYLGANDAPSSTNVPEPSLLADPKDKIEEQNLLHRAMLASDEGREDEARPALEKVLQLDPKSSTALRQLGELELHAGRFAQATDYFKRARAVRPDDAAAAFYEGQALEKSGDLSAARDVLEASAKLSPGQSDARLLLGKVYLALKNPKAAQDQFEAALLINPKSEEALLGVIKSQMQDGRYREALNQLEPLAISEPRNPEILELLAGSYRELGEKMKAESAEVRIRNLKTAKP